jgi:imidazolonepropionase-like amidohydrolase
MNGAKVCGIEKETGSLEAGKYADIIAVNGNPLEDINALRQVVAVMKRGKRVWNTQTPELKLEE